MTPKTNYSKGTPAAIVAHLRKHPREHAVGELAAALKVNARKVGDALRALVDSGAVARSGKRTAYRYKLADKE
jgi:DNA-binding IclR family transcriptional regulator